MKHGIYLDLRQSCLFTLRLVELLGRVELGSQQPFDQCRSFHTGLELREKQSGRKSQVKVVQVSRTDLMESELKRPFGRDARRLQET